jgi:hypothetical protein
VKGSLQAIVRVERGVSPRIVKAAIVGTDGTTYLHGSTLRAKLSLNSAWATFTSLSIAPAPSARATVASGGSVTLQGRLYPALAEGAAITLHENADGTWRTRTLTTSRHDQSLPDGHVAAYSSFSIALSPSQTTQYYFKSGNTTSPTTTVTVTG